MVTDVAAAASLQGNLHGEIVSWDLGSVEVPFQKVVDSLDAAGLPSDAAREMKAETAFGRAIKELKKDRTIDKFKKEGDVIQFQFTRKHLEESLGKIEFDYECKVTLDTDTGDIDCPESPEIELHARSMFAHAMVHRKTNDITRLVQKMFENAAELYPINPKKGVAYFVPEAHREFTARVEQFLESLGGRLLRFPVPKGTKEGNKSVRRAVEDGLATLVQELNAAVCDWSDTTRESTMDKAVERWKTIKHKAECYGEYLGERQSNLLAQLADAKQKLSEKIEALHAAKETQQAEEPAESAA